MKLCFQRPFYKNLQKVAKWAPRPIVPTMVICCTAQLQWNCLVNFKDVLMGIPKGDLLVVTMAVIHVSGHRLIGPILPKIVVLLHV